MGKRGRKDFRNKSGNFSKKSRQARDDIADAATGGWVDKREGDGFSEWVYTNDNFIKYYKVASAASLCELAACVYILRVVTHDCIYYVYIQAQGVVPEEEWDTFMKFLATPLPTTFRINNSCPFAERYAVRNATSTSSLFVCLPL